jgi:uncharacterized protein
MLALRIAKDLSLPPAGVAAVIELLDGGATVPFVARYRKEKTGGLDEVQIRAVAERRDYVRDLDERRATVLRSIEEQGKLTAELRARIEACATKAELEDLYLPFKPKRRTKATIARERGLDPLAGRILGQPRDGDPLREAAAFLGPEVATAEEALAGAHDIVVETIAERAELRAFIREILARDGTLTSRSAKKKMPERTKFEDWYDFREPIRKVPSHRYLAVARGETEGVLKVGIEVDDDRVVAELERRVGLDRRSPFARLLGEAVAEAYDKRLHPSLEKEVRAEAAERAERAAVQVFADNLQHLLLAAPFGGRPIVAVDPGVRTGCKCVALDGTGRYLDQVTVYPLRGDGEVPRAERELVAFVKKHRPDAIAVGNGTGGRETERFARNALKQAGLDPLVVSVNESGASVYSASDAAREELPDLDVTVRGAVSIGRRLQDPLAELVKIDPRAIGVGQYQHDVDQTLLGQKLHEVVESAVNRVGVELNTASAALLSYVAGIGPTLSKRIVAHRDEHGRFRGRRALGKVKGLGPKAFEQCAGFLRVREGDHPLDASGVHPERYPLVEQMAKDLGVALRELVGRSELARKIPIARYAGGEVGEPTLRDIVSELEKPGRDPRERFEAPAFRDDVSSLEDLKEGMVLSGVVTNVTAFGAFVDVGVHQDGLVHVSQLADAWVDDPRAVVKVGDRVTVRVVSVDRERRRIGLSRKGKM